MEFGIATSGIKLHTLNLKFIAKHSAVNFKPFEMVLCSLAGYIKPFLLSFYSHVEFLSGLGNLYIL